MLSLLGFPGTFGFIGKWYIISAVVAEGQYILPVILVLTSVISAGILPAGHHGDVHEVRRRSRTLRRGPALPAPPLGAIAVAIVAVLLFGVWPGRALDLAGRSAATLTQTAVPVRGRKPRERVNGQQG